MDGIACNVCYTAEDLQGDVTMAPTITVCIPTYNRAHYLGETIRSVLGQTLRDFELLICDDASTDNTAQVVASFKDPRIRYHRHATNVGIAANHKAVTEMAEGEFVAILPDDDLFLPDHLATALAGLAAYPNAAYYSCSLERFGDCATGIWRPAAISDGLTPLIYFSPRQAVSFLAIENPGFMNSIVCRKNRLKGTLFWGDPGFVHTDVLVLTQLMIQGGCLFANRPTVRYRCHSTNISRPTHNRTSARRLHLMLRYAIRYLVQLLLDTATCVPADIEAHGLSIPPQYAALLVLSLGSFHSSLDLKMLAKHVFRARDDIDHISATCRLARRVGFQVIPLSEQVSFLRWGWRP